MLLMPCPSTLMLSLKTPIVDIIDDGQSLAEWRTCHIIQLIQQFQDNLPAVLPPLPPLSEAANLAESLSHHCFPPNFMVPHEPHLLLHVCHNSFRHLGMHLVYAASILQKWTQHTIQRTRLNTLRAFESSYLPWAILTSSLKMSQTPHGKN